MLFGAIYATRAFHWIKQNQYIHLKPVHIVDIAPEWIPGFRIDPLITLEGSKSLPPEKKEQHSLVSFSWSGWYCLCLLSGTYGYNGLMFHKPTNQPTYWPSVDYIPNTNDTNECYSTSTRRLRDWVLAVGDKVSYNGWDPKHACDTWFVDDCS